MTVIIAGCRDLFDYSLVEQAVAESGFEITEVVSGCAPGIDTLGERWANDHGVPITRFPAEWNRYGRQAGPIRNEQMAKYAASKSGGLIAVWDGRTPGTKNMIGLGEQYHLRTHVKITGRTSGIARVRF